MRTVVTLLLFAYTLSSATADTTAKMIAFNCYSCHGERLEHLTLDSHSKKHLARTLIAFKTGQKQATIMGRITKGYSDAELQAVAHYLTGIN